MYDEQAAKVRDLCRNQKNIFSIAARIIARNGRLYSTNGRSGLSEKSNTPPAAASLGDRHQPDSKPMSFRWGRRRGAKQRRDLKTPEGLCYIDGRNATSACQRNLSVSYPHAADRANARRAGHQAGGDIKIHGLPRQPAHPPQAYLYSDWTWACIAVSDRKIEVLFTYVRPGARILIEP